MRLAAFFYLLLTVPVVSTADDHWTMTTADFHRAVISLEGMDEKGVRILAAGKPEATVAFDQLVRLDRGPSASVQPPKFYLYLLNGDRIAGEPAALKDEAILWSTAATGDLKIPVDQAIAFSRHAALAEASGEQKEDRVLLLNHDTVRGVITGIEDGKVNIQTAEATSVPVATADAVFFAGAGKPSLSQKRAWRIRLIDGSVITTPAARIKEGSLVFSLDDQKDAAPHATDLANVTTIEQINGPVSWLSDRAPAASQQTPFNAEGTYPARMDQNVFGKPLRIGSQVFEKGIGVHANSVLTFALDGSYQTFRTRYGIDTSADASKASVNIRIKLDGKVVHEQLAFRAYSLSPVVTIDLGTARELTLEVTAAGPTDAQDRLDWIEAALVKTGPATAP